MKLPLLIIWDHADRLGGMLRPLAESRRWQMREEREEDNALKWLARGHPAVLVVSVGFDGQREMKLLARVSWILPEVDTVVVAEAAWLSMVAWDLGAAYLMRPEKAREELTGIIAGLMGAERNDAADARG